MLTWSACITCLLLAALPLKGICQTGFYLTSPCNRGDINLKRFAPEEKNLCLVSSPIVMLEDIASISELATENGRQMFEMKLTTKGHAMLKTAFGLSPVIAFVVDDEIFFIVDTEKTQLYQTLKIFQADQSNFHRLHAAVRKELQIASRE